MKLRDEYKQELADLKAKMLDAQTFAEKFPAFSEKILANKWTAEFTGKMADSYKGLYYPWGIDRWFYNKKENITNYRGDFTPQYLWVIYINQLSVFGEDYADTGIYDLKNSLELFFFDLLNTTFYATDDQIIPLLDSLADWYAKAKPINDEYRKDKKKRDLLKQLEKLEDSTQ